MKIEFRSTGSCSEASALKIQDFIGNWRIIFQSILSDGSIKRIEQISFMLPFAPITFATEDGESELDANADGANRGRKSSAKEMIEKSVFSSRLSICGVECEPRVHLNFLCRREKNGRSFHAAAAEGSKQNSYNWIGKWGRRERDGS